MARAGRKRMSADREPNGRVQRHYEPAILARTLEIRGAGVGLEHARDAKAGYLIGRLELSGKILPEQYFAALRAGYIWGMHEKILSRELGAPKRNVPCVQFYGCSLGKSLDEITEEKQSEIREAVAGMDLALKDSFREWVFVRSMLQDIIMEGVLPPSMEVDRQHPFYGKHWELFRNALSALAIQFGIGD
jgi:hypothetical protein